MRSGHKEDPRAVLSKTRLSDALLSLLKTKRIEEISVKAIVEQAKTSPLTFYNHFRNKADLLDYSFYSNVEPVLQSLPNLLRGALTREEALERVIHAFVHFVYDRLPILRRFVREDGSKTIYWALTTLVRRVFSILRHSYGALFDFADVPDKVLDTFVAGGLTYLIYDLLLNSPGYTEQETTRYFLLLLGSQGKEKKMAKILEAVASRHSVRSYLDRKVPMDDVRTVLEAGNLAPTGRNTQNLLLVGLVDEAKRKEILSFLGGGKEYYGAPVLVFALEREKDGLSVQNASAALENMMLQATALGLSSCWIHCTVQRFNTPEGQELLRRVLGLPKTMPVVETLALGYGEGECAGKARDERNIAIV